MTAHLKLLLLGTACLSGLAASPASATRRVAIVVGSNAGLEDELQLHFAEADAQKITQVLVTLAGYGASDVTTLVGQRAQALRVLLRSLGETAARTRRAGSDRLEVFFYYSGHGDGTNLHMNGSRFPLAELRAVLARLQAALTIVLIDSCQSGAMTRIKGARPGPAFAIELLEHPEAKGSITITSSRADEVSQESDTLQGSFFTHYWVSGLYGRADANSDGLVTLEEAYRYAHYQTVDRTIESRGGVQHPSYRYSLSGHGNVVLSNLSRSSGRILISTSTAGGRYFILDGDKQLVLTEVQQSRAGLAEVRLPPGKYKLRKREARRMLVADVVVPPGRAVAVRDADMAAQAYATPSAKGTGLPLGVDAHGPRLMFGVRNGITADMGVASQLKMGYRVHWRLAFIEPRAVLRWAAMEGLAAGRRYLELDLGGAVGLGQWRHPWYIGLGLDGGLLLFDQGALLRTTSGPPEGIMAVGLQGGLMGELGYHVARGLWLFLDGGPGLVAFKADGRAQTEISLSVSLGLTYRFR